MSLLKDLGKVSEKDSSISPLEKLKKEYSAISVSKEPLLSDLSKTISDMAAVGISVEDIVSAINSGMSAGTGGAGVQVFDRSARKIPYSDESEEKALYNMIQDAFSTFNVRKKFDVAMGAPRSGRLLVAYDGKAFLLQATALGDYVEDFRPYMYLI